MEETEEGGGNTPKKLSSRMVKLSPYEVVEDWTIGRAEEVEGNRTKAINPWGIVDETRVDPSELVALPEEEGLEDFYKRVEEIFKQVGFTDQDLTGDDSVRKSVRVPRSGVLWFEFNPANPDKRWLPDADTMEIFEVRGELNPSPWRRAARLVNPDLAVVEHEILEVGPYVQARYELNTPKYAARRVDEDNPAKKRITAEVVGDVKTNPEVLLSSGSKFLDRVSGIVNAARQK